MTPQERGQLGGMTHSRAHMRAISAMRRQPGRKPFPTYAQSQADPRMRRLIRELKKEFGGGPSTE